MKNTNETNCTTRTDCAQFAEMPEAKAILNRFGNDSAKLIPIFQAVQEHYRYLPEDVLSFISVSLGVPSSRVFGVATFYSHFALQPKGKFVIRVCDGTACHVKGSEAIIDALYEKLGVSKEKQTSADMMFTVETVSCLGACGLAPVLLVNDEVVGQGTAEKAVKAVEQICTVKVEAEETLVA